jgi:ribonuclease HI
MAKKFYVVWSGRQTGVFDDWTSTHALVDQFPGARFKSFPTRAEAEQAFRKGKPATVPRSSRASSATAKKSKPEVTAEVQIYCDGACEPNPGNAGSGLAVYRGGTLSELWYGLYHPNGTNNTAELNALHHAMLLAEQVIREEQTVEVLSDSKYAISCISVWADGWQKRGWRRADGEIKNLDIIKAAHELYGRIKASLQLHHVSAHVGTEGNELADRMSILAVEKRQQELRLYDEQIDIPAILRMRAG